MKRKRAGRLASLALCVMMTAASVLTAFADGGTFVLEECGDLQITLPDNMSAVTRTSESTDRYYTRHNLSYVDVQRAFMEGEIYLQAMDNDNNVTLTLSCLDTEAQDFDELSDSELSEVAGRFVSSISNEVQYNTSTQDEAGTETPWIFFNMTVTDPDGNKTRQYQATTVKNGKNITLTLYRNGGDVDLNDYQTLEAIARTVEMPGEPFYQNKWFWIIAGCSLVVIIVLIIIISLAVKKSKSRKTQDKNDRIIEELAGKYQKRPTGTPEDDVDIEVDITGDDYKESISGDKTYDDISDKGSLNKFADLYSSSAKSSKSSSAKSGEGAEPEKKDFYGDSEPKPKYSDEEIERLLSGREDKRNFDQTLPETQADSEQASEVSDSVNEKTPAITETTAEEAAEETVVTEGAAPVAEEIAASANTENKNDISNLLYALEAARPEPPQNGEGTGASADSGEPDAETPETAEEAAEDNAAAGEADGYETADEQPEAFLMEEEQPGEVFPEEEDLPQVPPIDEEIDFSAHFREKRRAASFEAAEEVEPEETAPETEDDVQTAEDTEGAEETEAEEPETEAEEPETAASEPIEEKPSAPVETVLIYKRPEKKPKPIETEETVSEEISEDESSSSEESESSVAEETPEESAETFESQDEPEETEDTEEAADEGESGEDAASNPDDEFEEYVQDEVLVREESRQERFRDSSDFFEEAPSKRSFAKIVRDNEPREEIIPKSGAKATYGEVKGESGEPKPKKGVPEPVKKIGSGFKSIGGGVKSFGTHCGYFAENIKREVRHSKIKKKRRREEELRTKQQNNTAPKAAAAKPADPAQINKLVQAAKKAQSAQAAQPSEPPKKSSESRRISNGLVQVHSRGDHAPKKRD